jgi:hypothetical protein
MFQGPKANTGTVSHYVGNGKSMLKVSDDFKVPDIDQARPGYSFAADHSGADVARRR